MPDTSPTSGSPVPFICNPSGAILRTLSIVFQRGSTANDFENTVQCIFDMIDSRLDPATNILTPRVSTRILHGLEGLRRFMPLVSRKRQPPHRAKLVLCICQAGTHFEKSTSVLTYRSRPSSLPCRPCHHQTMDSNYSLPQQRNLSPTCRRFRDIVQSNWHELQSYRHVGPEPRSLEIIFDLMVEFVSPDGPGLVKVFQGMVDDTEGEGQPSTLSITAESKDLHTRQLVVLWEDDIAGAPLPLV